MAKYPETLTTLLSYLRKLPGVGSKTAERYGFHLLEWKEENLHHLSTILSEIKSKILYCPKCHCFLDETACYFCDAQKRDPSTLCIVSSAKDVYPIEETKIYKGLYHVLGGLLSPLEGRLPKDLQIEDLKERIVSMQIQDVILALDSTIEGDATSLFLKEEIGKWSAASVYRLAMGIPLGSSLDYIDAGTLAKAFLGKQNF